MRSVPISVSSVVLPEPDGPVMITICPSYASKWLSNSTCFRSLALAEKMIQPPNADAPLRLSRPIAVAFVARKSTDDAISPVPVFMVRKLWSQNKSAGSAAINLLTASSPEITHIAAVTPSTASASSGPSSIVSPVTRSRIL